jgi:hypothetical protein
VQQQILRFAKDDKGRIAEEDKVIGTTRFEECGYQCFILELTAHVYDPR